MEANTICAYRQSDRQSKSKSGHSGRQTEFAGKFAWHGSASDDFVNYIKDTGTARFESGDYILVCMGVESNRPPQVYKHRLLIEAGTFVPAHFEPPSIRLVCP